MLEKETEWGPVLLAQEADQRAAEQTRGAVAEKRQAAMAR
jgi:hypothetical protein